MCSQKINFILHILWIYCKNIANLLLWVLWACLTMHIQSDTINLWKTFILSLSAGKKFNPSFSGDIAKICKLIINWLHTLKMIVSTRRKPQCLSACHKQTSSFTSFLRYYISNNPAICLLSSILVHNSRTRILPDTGLIVKYQCNISFHIRLFPGKTNDKIFQKTMTHSWEKHRTDEWTDRWTHRQRWFYRILHRTGVWYIKIISCFKENYVTERKPWYVFFQILFWTMWNHKQLLSILFWLIS